MIESLQADIQKAESDAAVLTQQIAELDADINAWSADKKAATEVSEPVACVFGSLSACQTRNL